MQQNEGMVRLLLNRQITVVEWAIEASLGDDRSILACIPLTS